MRLVVPRTLWATRFMSNSGSSTVDRCPSPNPPTGNGHLSKKIVFPTVMGNNYPVRKIALKFCYSGSEYSGLAFQEGPTPLPTVEGVLFNAMAQTFLVDLERGLEGCGWERCGRTDRGVSAAGQVVSVWVRTALKTQESRGSDPGHGSERTRVLQADSVDDCGVGEQESRTDLNVDSDAPGLLGDLAFPEDLLDDDGDENGNDGLPSNARSSVPELRYVSIINRVLPPTIRVLAWTPVAPEFSARFACKYRHYKYFFRPHRLDIPRMQDGARRLVGEHDFRNLCKLDPAKQITNFRRVILRAEIGPVVPLSSSSSLSSTSSDDQRVVAAIDDPSSLYVLDLVGTAFLYHQVRHIMAVLFLVGAGLEHPSVVSSLLNVSADHHPDVPQNGDPPLQVVDRKPEYQMADGLPLVLWDCGYSDSDVKWCTDDGDNDDGGRSKRSHRSTASADIHRQLQSEYTRSLIRSALDAHFLAAATQYHPPTVSIPFSTAAQHHDVTYIPLGGGTFRRATKYVPLLARNRMDSVENTNERWRLGKGLRKLERHQADRTADICDDDE